MSDSHAVHVKHLKKKALSGKKQILILDDINLTIPKTSFTVIKGPSGAGKSTLLYLIGLLDKTDEGEITLLNQSTKNFSNHKASLFRKKNIGFVFQNYHLLPELTALENIMLPGLVCGDKESLVKKKAFSLLERVNLKSRSHHRSPELSGGEQQRICLCRALIHSPQIILADEPTGNLDSHNASLVEELLKSLVTESKATLILVTHNEALAKQANYRVALLDGKVVS